MNWGVIHVLRRSGVRAAQLSITRRKARLIVIWNLFWRITLPLLKPVIIIATLLKTIFSLKMFDQVVTMTGGGPGRSTQTLNYFVYLTAFRNLDMGYSAALAFILLTGLAIFAYFYVRTLSRPTGA